VAYRFASGSSDIINCGTSVGHAATWSVAVRLKVAAANTNLRRIVAFEQPSGGFKANLFANFSTGTNQLFVGHSVGGNFFGPNWVTGWTAGSTHVFVVTYDGTTIRLYGDTDLTPKATDINGGTSDQDADQVFCIGNLASFSNGADSDIYEVAWFPGVVLGPTQAVSLGGGGQQPGWVAVPTYYWPLVSDANALYGGQNGTVTGATLQTHAGGSWFPGLAATPPEIWFQPSSNPDTLTLWDTPSAWDAARRKISAYFFWDTLSDPLPPGLAHYGPFGTCIGANYESRNAYAQCASAGIKIGIEPGIEAVSGAIYAADSIANHGGALTYMDLDWTLARISPSWDHTDGDLTRVANAYKSFCDTVHASYPLIQIGDIEGFFRFTPAEIAAWIDRCASVGAPLPWFSLDVKWQGGHIEEAQAVQQICRDRNLPLHIYVTPGEIGAESVASDQEYFEHTWAAAQAIHDNLPGATHLILASWYNDLDSLRQTPANLPQTGPYTHTKLLLDVADLFGVPDVDTSMPTQSATPGTLGVPAISGVYLSAGGTKVAGTLLSRVLASTPGGTATYPKLTRIESVTWRGSWRGASRGRV